MRWVKKKNRIGIVTIIAFLLTVGPISWIVYGNDDKDITYSIQEEMEEGTGVNLLLEITPSEKVKEITRIEMPDGGEVEKKRSVEYRVEENGEYRFIVYYRVVEGSEEIEEKEKVEEITYEVKSIKEGEIEQLPIEEEIKSEGKVEESVKNEEGIPATYATGNIQIDAINFPDDNFRNYLLTDISDSGIKGYGKDGFFSPTEIANITYIGVHGKDIKNLTGIEHFTNLLALSCYSNQLETLDLRYNTKLMDLDCKDNRLTNLDLSNNVSLSMLQCQNNKLTSLDVSKNNRLMALSCKENLLTELLLSKESGNALADLHCYNNKLTYLDVSKNTNLSMLFCYGNAISSLYLENNPVLEALKCQNNLLTSLNLSNNSALISLDCSSNNLINLSISNNANLTEFYGVNQNRTIYLVAVNSIWKSATDYHISSLTNSLVTYNSNKGQFTSPSNSNTTGAFKTDCVYGENKTVSISGLLTFSYVSDPSAILIDDINFPDNNFRNYLLTDVDSQAISGRGMKGYFISEDINKILKIEINNKSIKDLKGIEHFTNITGLSCYMNELKNLDISKNTKLKSMNCSNNHLLSVDLSKNIGLTSFVGDNQTREIEMQCYGPEQWKSEEYSISKVTSVNITYDASTKQILSPSPNEKSSTFVTTLEYADKKAELKGTLTFRYTNIIINEANFPDEKFRKYLLTDNTTSAIKEYGKDGKFSTEEIADITYIGVHDEGIKDLKGIEHFTNITALSCYMNELTDLDISKNTKLKSINCSNNHLLSVDLSKNIGLTSFVGDNQTREIEMQCYGPEQWKSEEYSISKVTSVNITYDASTKQILSPSPNEKSSTFVTTLEYADKKADLKGTLTFRYTNIIINEANFPDEKFRKYLLADNTTSAIKEYGKDGKFSTEEIADITYIGVHDEGIKDLKGIEHFTNITALSCYMNELTDLDISKNTKLKGIDCSNNHLLSVDLSKNTELTSFVGDNQTREIEMQCYGPEQWRSEVYSISKVTSVNITYDASTKQIISPSPNEKSSTFVTTCKYADKKADLKGTLTFRYTNVIINEANFPDKLFRDYLLTDNTTSAIKGYGKDKKFSAEEIADITYIGVHNKKIKNLKGIEHFTNITALSCYMNELTDLDISKNTKLKGINCSDNHLLSVDLSKNTELTSFVGDNQTREIEMNYYEPSQWKSKSSIFYTITSLTNTNITYNSSTGQFTTRYASNPSSVFSTTCMNMGKKQTVSGTLNFVYPEFIPTSNISVLSPVVMIPGDSISLSGTVEPANASEKAITWSIKDAGTTGATLSDTKLTTTASGIVVVTATVTGGTLTDSYSKDFSIAVKEINPAVLVVIPAKIELEKLRNDTMFEAVKETEVSIQENTNLTVYEENFYVRAEPKCQMLHTEYIDEWFTAQIYDEANNMYTSKDTPLAILNATTKSQKFYVKAFKDIARKTGVYKGTMKFIIGYGETS